jgi:putative PIN family toxin of toxin-antitoxin system
MSSAAMTPAEMVVVLDTNVLIPLSIPASRSTRLFSRLLAAGITVAVSPQILEEVREKMLTKETLRRWLGLSDRQIEQFLEDLATLTRLVPGVTTAAGAVPADPDDDAIVAAAVEAGASYIVSQDRHLLDLGDFSGIKIVSIEVFEAELDRLGVPSG